MALSVLTSLWDYMSSATRIGFATLVAALFLFSPIGTCAESMKASGAPAHPCCPAEPAPLQEDCAKPGCIFMDNHIVPLAIAPVHASVPLCEPPASASLTENRAAVVIASANPAAYVLHYRFVVFHQFLI